ncbi:MAG TPA: response regulator transcription factor [Casimicrobiaceae bacterium]|jgi:DNA-binding NarL/FixJ family response regulator
MKILLADDHALIRSGLRSELQSLDAGIEFIDAWNAASLREKLESNPDIDLALVDLTMPGMSGARSIADLRRDYPVVPLIVVSGADASTDVQAVMRAGASGFIPKAAMSKIMMQAIRLVLAGGQYLPPQLMQMVPSSEVVPSANVVTTRAAGTRDAGRLALMSPRQFQVFELLAQGLSNKSIARELDITEGTVKSHVATTFDVLNVHNRVSAVAEARRLQQDHQSRRELDD